MATSASGAARVPGVSHPARKGKGTAGTAATAPGCLPYCPLVLIAGSMALGILWDRHMAAPLGAWWGAALVAAAMWGHLWRRTRNTAAAICLLLAVMASSGAWHHYRWRCFPADEIGRCARELPEPVCLEVMALSWPRRRPAPPPDPMCTLAQEDYSQLPVAVLRARDGRDWRGMSGNAMLTVKGLLPHIRDGDLLRVWGMLSAPPPANNPGEFDFAGSERGHRRLCRLRADSPDCVLRLRTGLGRGVRHWLSRLRQQGHTLLWQQLDPARAGLASAILLGTREEVGRERTDEFFKTGTVHVLSISGLHVGILAYGFWWVARLGGVSRRGTLIAALFMVVAYAALTDAGPPVERAAVLISTLCVARLSGRRTQPFNTLAFAGIVVLLLNPTSLFQTGSQLSFLAVGGLTCVRQPAAWGRLPDDPLERLIARTRPWPLRVARQWSGRIAGLLFVSAVVWLATLPLVMYRFHLVTPVAVLLNPIICFPVAAALFSGFGVLLLGGFSSLLASVCGTICDGSLALTGWLIRGALLFRGGYFWGPSPPLWWVLAFYAAAAALVAAAGPRRRWRLLMAAAWLALGLAYTHGPLLRWGTSRGKGLLCTFVSVGHGTSVLVELPDGYTLLYDAGRQGLPYVAGRSISAVLWSRGLRHLDALVLSHADADHFNAVPDLLERFTVNNVYVSPVMLQAESPAMSELWRCLARAGSSLRLAAAGDPLRLQGSTRVTVLHPPRGGCGGSDNANSLVLCIECAGHRILLPGDLEPPGLEALAQGPNLPCEVAMAPHHGSMHSQPSRFVAWTTPKWVIISESWQQDIARAKRAFRVGGRSVLHMAECGAVRVAVDAAAIHVRCWRNDPW